MPKEAELPGVEGPGVAPVRIIEIDTLAEEYVKWRDKRLLTLEKEIAAKEALITEIHTHAEKLGSVDGVISYRAGDLMITLEAKDKLKVKALQL
jgi:hypothetical protein